jgi:hypothetical protein
MTRNLFLTKTLNCLPSLHRIERKPLSWCLRKIGATPVNKNASGYLCFHTSKLTGWQLHDLYLECRGLWIAGCKDIQTQFTKNHEQAARWNTLWNRLKELFKRRGIEVP